MILTLIRLPARLSLFMSNSITRTPAYSLPSILAIVAAIGSFATGPGFGLLLAIAAILLGIVGVVISLLPGIPGGILSIFSVLVGVIGIIGALLRIIF